MSTHQSYGEALPDQVERIVKSVKSHIDLIGDVREVYREQAALEREYAGKLQALAKKAAEKKAKIEAVLVLGDEPTKAWNEYVVKRSTLIRAYNEIVNSLSSSSQEHVDLADAITSQIVDVLKAIERRSEDMRKKEFQFFERLLSEKEKTNSERLKSKQKYDAECTEEENARHKQKASSDDRHAERANKQYEQKRDEMLNSKNLYIISTAICNSVKNKFYTEDIPSLENQLQALQSNSTQRFVNTLIQAQSLQLHHIDNRKARLAAVEKILRQVDPAADQDIYIEHNIRAFTTPADAVFEPCATHYDTPDMSVEPTSKIFLQNKLNKCRSKLEDMSPDMKATDRELEKLAKSFQSCSADPALRNVDEISENYVDASHRMAMLSISHRMLNAEVETILATIGDDEGTQQPHSFKSSTFSIPSNCCYCKSSIWGLTKQGKTCTLCGISVHSKCELKVPAECRSSKAKVPPSSSNQSRSSSTLSRSDTQGPSIARSSTVAPPPVKTPQSFPEATVLFDFSGDSPFQLSVTEGQVVQVIEEPDETEWVKVADGRGGQGLVPASYIEMSGSAQDVNTSPVPSASSRPAQGGSGAYVRGLHAWDAQDPDELDVQVGELIELTAGPKGGQNYDEGWWEGINKKGKKGLFPSNYVELVN